MNQQNIEAERLKLIIDLGYLIRHVAAKNSFPKHDLIDVLKRAKAYITGLDPDKVDMAVEATCLDCGVTYAPGYVQYRTLDAFDDNPEAYCAVCEGINLEFSEDKTK